MKNQLYFVAGIFTAVLIVFALHRFGYDSLFDSPTTVKIINEAISPDGAYTATTNRASNTNGWCEERTNVHKTNQSFDWEQEYIFNIGCGSEVNVMWKDDRNLIINYSYDDKGEVGFSRQFLSADKAVKISYSLKQ